MRDKLKKFGEDLRQSLVEDIGIRERAMIEGIEDNYHKKSAVWLYGIQPLKSIGCFVKKLITAEQLLKRIRELE